MVSGERWLNPLAKETKEKSTSQPPSPGVGQPSAKSYRASDIVLTEIAKLQSDGEYTRRDLGETRTDMRDLRDRMAKLEVRVDHLPSKEFIIKVVLVSLTLMGGLLTIAPKLQSWAGTSPASTSVPALSPAQKTP